MLRSWISLSRVRRSSDPCLRRGVKDLLPIATQAIEFFPERLDLVLSVQRRLCQRAAPAVFADEVDEVRKAPFLG